MPQRSLLLDLLFGLTTHLLMKLVGQLRGNAGAERLFQKPARIPAFIR